MCPQDGFTHPTTVAAPVSARWVHPSWCFPELSSGLFLKLMTANYASYNLLIALKRTVLWMKSLVTRVFFEFTPVFPENSLVQGLQLQLSFLGTERVKGKCPNANYSHPLPITAHPLLIRQEMEGKRHTTLSSFPRLLTLNPCGSGKRPCRNGKLWKHVILWDFVLVKQLSTAMH